MENPIILSILICTINGREKSLNNLLTLLNKQQTGCVEILIEKDNKEKTTGEKRNILINKAIGNYICFIDDDDEIHPNYISKILTAVGTQPDCVGIEGLITFQSKKITRKFTHSIQYREWFSKNEIYYRCPNHLNPVKLSIAKQVLFPNLTVGEDHDYSIRLLPFLKTEVYINEPIYYYKTN